MNLATFQLQHYSWLYIILYKGSSLRALLIVGRGVLLNSHLCKGGNAREIMAGMTEQFGELLCASMTEGGTAIFDGFASHI
jgi:hypothetical protein